MSDISLLNQQLKGKTAEEIITFFSSQYKGKLTFANSLGAEDQVITHMICDIDKSIPIFTLDTGRMFPENYSIIERTNQKYGINIKVQFPNHLLVEEMVEKYGINLFYDSIENRKLCCAVRKMEPLKRALSGYDVWICGLRRSQSMTRNNMNIVEWDTINNLIKVNPLIEWSNEDVWSFIETRHVPYNKLHDKGFTSIGCLPCTRAIETGEDIRAGRWWWENPEHKECGLHKK